MAKGKFQKWLEPANLARITNWAANGLTLEEIAKSMGISRSTFMAWLVKFSDIKDAVEKGRCMCAQCIENALFARATGACYAEETIEEYRGELRDGKPSNGIVVKRTVKKQLPPDVGAQIFYLKNRMSDRYADIRKTEVTGAVPTISLGIAPERADD